MINQLISLGISDLTITNDGISAVELIEIENQRGAIFDLVLCDFKMPNMDGLNLFNWIRTQRKLDKTQFIMVSAIDDTSLILSMKKAGLKEFILKPVEGLYLHKKIEKVCRFLRDA
ncbi:MAG: response regulator [Halobacteriovoraceae bacterium]|nr:response regulator [Halobacteriovoraceae bacterium]